MYFLARICLDPENGKPDPHAAMQWLVQAGEAGHAPAYNDIGLMYSKGEGVRQDIVRAVQCFDRGARLGDARAQFNLANCYLTGEGIEADRKLAAQWYRAAADQGLGDAQYNLAVLLMAGDGIEPDKLQGLTWLAKAADNGVAQAQYELARRLRTGDGVPRDLLQSMHYYHEAADQGHVEAAFALALMLEAGAGLDRPYPEQAAGWYEKLAVAQVHAGAAHNLGILYVQGRGVTKDARKARDLFELAIAMSGDEAMASLSLLLMRGEAGVPRDLVEAAMWAMLSIQHEPGGMGEQLLATVSPHLTPQQLGAANDRASNWKRTTKMLEWDESSDRKSVTEKA
jgi:TPR repeat protein